ncbi:uncharacterized protein LOC101848024 [Aplysia californica]|uniref:Uncharacterized protein LOC101848024 n=1 Tax=Aplysia californica TaxID=6500 RepID=A0ABM0ZU87_APLCA|nr:uncharacterized protein LOC101848024 [Aplysia californica]
MLTWVALLALLGASQAFLLDSFRQEKWDALKVTWNANPFASNAFNSMPRTEADAQKQGFRKISECDTSAQWRGRRYVKGDDYSVVLLFDVNGFIAGMQTSFADNQPSGFPKVNLQPPFVKDGDRFTISAYFVDPSTICTTGRTAADFASQGTGINLYLQKTADPEASVLIPHQESGIGATKWTEGKCFYTMGKHYWYDLSEDMNCDDYFPVFLLYNNGELTAFGWALLTDLSSQRYEHPGQDVYKLFMKTPPKCIFNAGTISTMHIYLTSNVALDVC